MSIGCFRLRKRLSQPERASSLWLSTPSVIVAWVGLLAAALSRPHGSGFLQCWYQSATGLPCPGCGLTRSLSCALRGLFTESWNYHPFGLLILVLFMVTAAQTLLPKVLRARLHQAMQSRALFFNSLYLAFVVSFVGFGVARALVNFLRLATGGR